MRTSRLPTIHASVASYQMSALGGPQMNKFEQVSGLGQQMSLTMGSSSKHDWTGFQSWKPDVTSRGCNHSWGVSVQGQSQGISVQSEDGAGTKGVWWGPMYHG